MQFQHQTSQFKLNVFLKDQQLILFDIKSKNGNMLKYTHTYTAETIPNRIKHLIKSGLIDDFEDLLKIFLSIKSTLKFNEVNKKLTGEITFCHKVKIIEFIIEKEVIQQNELSQMIIGFSQLTIINDQENQIKKNNGQIYFGSLQQPSGKYQGQLLNGLKHGKGQNLFYSGDFYKGQFAKGLRNGYGEYFYKNGSKIQCNFHKGKKNGKGRTFYSNGDIQESFYKNDLRDGPNMYKSSKTGQLQISIYKLGLMESIIMNFMKNGDIFLRTNLKDSKSRQGKYFISNGQMIQGDFKNGKLNGIGTYYFNNGTIRKGNYKNGLLHGQFIKTLNTGEQIKQYWFENLKVTEDEFISCCEQQSHYVANPLPVLAIAGETQQ